MKYIREAAREVPVLAKTEVLVLSGGPAKRVIDATGVADIAFRAGAPLRMASKKDLMGVTVTFS